MKACNEMYTDKLKVMISSDRRQMGIKAAEDVVDAINKVINERGTVNMIFAAAPSQDDFFAAIKTMSVDWSKINAFHMDEYIGLDKDAVQGFGNFLKARLFDVKPFKSVNCLDGSANIEEECQRYEALLRSYPADIVCMGIGENGHIAFNDPHVASFDDSSWVKVVDLDQKCRIQQVNDGCFESVDQVPTHALTLTVPALVSPEYVFCIVPASTKAEAVKATLEGPISEVCPASVLRQHEKAVLYIDKDSASLIER